MSLEARVESLVNSMLADITRLKLENGALLTSLSKKERQIVSLQEQLHAMQHCGSGEHDSVSWIEDEEQYVAMLQNFSTNIQHHLQ